MRFIQIRDLRLSEVWDQLADEREMVITAQGKPIAILSYVSDANWEETLAAFRRVRFKPLMNCKSNRLKMALIRWIWKR